MISESTFVVLTKCKQKGKKLSPFSPLNPPLPLVQIVWCKKKLCCLWETGNKGEVSRTTSCTSSCLYLSCRNESQKIPLFFFCGFRACKPTSYLPVCWLELIRVFRLRLLQNLGNKDSYAAHMVSHTARKNTQTEQENHKGE